MVFGSVRKGMHFSSATFIAASDALLSSSNHPLQNDEGNEPDEVELDKFLGSLDELERLSLIHPMPPEGAAEPSTGPKYLFAGMRIIPDISTIWPMSSSMSTMDHCVNIDDLGTPNTRPQILNLQ